jgi:hypothetical protein
MIITYCENCGARMKTEKSVAEAKCEDCKSGKRAPVRQRDSGQIPREKLDHFKMQDAKKRGKSK